MKRPLYYLLCAIACTSMVSATLPVSAIAEAIQPRAAAQQQAQADATSSDTGKAEDGTSTNATADTVEDGTATSTGASAVNTESADDTPTANATDTAAPGTAPEGAAAHAAKAAVEAARRGRRRAATSARRPRAAEAPQPAAGAGKNIGHRPDDDNKQHNADHKGQDGRSECCRRCSARPDSRAARCRRSHSFHCPDLRHKCSQWCRPHYLHR